jgi:hypothetical protein
MENVLNSIYDFCRKARNRGTAFANGDTNYPERVKFIANLLEKIGVYYFIDSFQEEIHEGINFHNVVIPGTSKYIVIAHHDIVKPESDNANDNSASVINAIYLKSICPEATVVLTDSEEVGMYGAKRLSKQIKDGIFGDIKGVINLELSGVGGKNIIIGDYPGDLNNRIKYLFGAPSFSTPPSDTVVFRRDQIDSTVINPLPLIKENFSEMPFDGMYFDNSSWGRCHSTMDSVDRICIKDMKEFVEEILIPLIKD